METKKSEILTEDHTRHDRSRSPHRDRHPWEKTGKPKSVLYPADVQYFRQRRNCCSNSHKGVQHNCLHCKASSRKSGTGCSSSMKSIASPLKQSKANNKQRDRRSHHLDPDASIQRAAERLQRWTEVYSPPKFMAGLVPKNEKHETIVCNQTTPKSRLHEPWTVEYFLKGSPDLRKVNDDRMESKKKLCSNMIGKGTEKENRRTISSSLAENGSNVEYDPMNDSCHHGVSQMITSDVVEKNSDDSAIPPVEKSITPDGQKFEAQFLTPGISTSLDEVFFTPMTHVRPLERNTSFTSDIHSSTLKLTPPFQPTKFSLSEANISAVPSPFERTASIKERTESQLDAFDRVSSKLDIAIQNVRDVLSRPINLGLPSLNASNMPVFSDVRQTIDCGQLRCNPKRESHEDVKSSRRSLPVSHSVSYHEMRPSTAFDPSLDSNTKVFSEMQSDISSSANVSGASEKQRNNKEGRNDVSLAKALGSSMAAELAYADRIEQARKQLEATRRLVKAVSEKIDHVKSDADSDFDKVLNSISLQDGSSLVMSDDGQTSDDVNSHVPVTVSVGHEKKVAVNSGTQTDMRGYAAQRNELREQVNSYIRMRKQLRNLQLVVLKLKKRSTSTSKQMAKLEKLIKSANDDCAYAISRANSWLKQRMPQQELLMFIKTRQKKLYIATEECVNTIERLLGLESLKDKVKSKDALLSSSENCVSQNGHRALPVRIDTEALNKSVECDMWNLSARSMRRNLEARREQAEILNKSFEEISKDIEKRTKKSIAAQIVQYDRVIAERADLITQLDKISSDEKSEEYSAPLSTPRRDGVEPLDLGQLSPQPTSFDKQITNKPSKDISSTAALVPPLTDQADVGICRSHSRSTVYEDSVSHLGDDEENKSCSASSETTLYQDSQEKDESDIFEGSLLPSRRTLDTAEILAMLSRHVVTVVSDGCAEGDVEQSVEKLFQEVVQEKVIHEEDINEGINEVVHLDLEGKAEEVGRTMTDTEDVAAVQSEASLVSWDAVKDEEKESTSKLGVGNGQDVILSSSAGERGSCGDVAYVQEDVSLDISLGQFHLAGMETRLNIVDKLDGQAVVVMNPVTVEESGVANQLSAEHTSAPILPSQTSHSDLFLKSSSDSNEDIMPPLQHQDILNDKFVSKTAEIVADGSEGLYQHPDDTTNYGEYGEKSVISLSNVVAEEPDVGKEFHGEEIETSEGGRTSAITFPELSSEEKPIGVIRAENLDARSDVESSEQLDPPTENWQSNDEERMSTVDGDYSAYEHAEEKDGVPENMAVTSDKITEGFELGEETKNTEFQESSKVPVEVPQLESQELPKVITEEVHNHSTSSNNVTIELDNHVEASTIVSENIHEKGDVLSEKSETKEMETVLESVKENVEVSDSSILDCTSGGVARLSFTKNELLHDLSSLIMQSMETASPRRRSVLPDKYRYVLSDSLLDDSTSSLSRSPRSSQERFMTKMPSSFSPRLESLSDESLLTQIPETIAQEETMRALAGDVISNIDKEIAQLEHRRSSSNQNNEAIVSSEPLIPLDESYEDLFAIKKPPSLFDKPLFTSPTEETLIEYEANQRLRLEERIKEVNSQEWMKNKCFHFSKEVWRLVTLKGFMRPLFDEFISAPKLEDDVHHVDEKERLLVQNKSMLIWNTVVELSAMLWPESSQKRGLISSKWLPIPKNCAEFAKMAERYMLEQLSELPSSHRYKRLSRPWASDNSETMVDEAVARHMYNNGANFTRKVNKEYRKLCEELIELVGDRFVSSEVQEAQHCFAASEHDSEVINTPPSSYFNGEDGRPSLARLSTSTVWSVGRRSSGGTTVPLRVASEK